MARIQYSMLSHERCLFWTHLPVWNTYKMLHFQIISCLFVHFSGHEIQDHRCVGFLLKKFWTQHHLMSFTQVDLATGTKVQSPAFYLSFIWSGSWRLQTQVTWIWNFKTHIAPLTCCCCCCCWLPFLLSRWHDLIGQRADSMKSLPQNEWVQLPWPIFLLPPLIWLRSDHRESVW